MRQRTFHIFVGVVVYLSLILFLFGFYHVAFGDGGGPIPLWFAVTQTLLEGITAVLPGLVAGWLSREDGFTIGAVVGAFGSVLGAISLASLSGFFPFEFRMAVGTVAATIAATFTNAVGGSAGEHLRNRARPSNRLSEPTP